MLACGSNDFTSDRNVRMVAAETRRTNSRMLSLPDCPVSHAKIAAVAWKPPLAVEVVT